MSKSDKTINNSDNSVKESGRYNPQAIEEKWQEIWEKEGVSTTKEPTPGTPKMYVLDMFPYPSGAGLHVGHIEGYTGTDILSRYYRMKGFAVLHPMGWDAFGLPAENNAIKKGVPPAINTAENVAGFTRQIKRAGLSYDWSRELDSSSPDYYKWTQWLFVLFFKHGLAYRKKAPANWCPSCETVLANEQVVSGKCERCENEVVQKDLEQWFFNIVTYADRLLEGIEKIDWPASTKAMQKNWIGKKEGVEITYDIEGIEEKVTVFTTRPDTNFGATFIVLAPENPLALKISTDEHREQVLVYVEAAKKKKELERLSEGRKKTGVFTGRYAINQLNGEKMPIWVGDFVLMTVGTGALVGVPGHDQRDFEFAKEFNLPIKRVVVGSDGQTGEISELEQVQEEEGTMVNSGFLDGKEIHEATTLISDYLEEKGWGKRVKMYHLRDWLLSRQRYWGAPIPMIYCEKCAQNGKSWFTTDESKDYLARSEAQASNKEYFAYFKSHISNLKSESAGWYPVPDADLPVLLPTDVDFKPTGESPIARSQTFQSGAVCPGCGAPARREVDTMDTFVDSSWYFLRFADPHNSLEFANSGKMASWLPVDTYVGGAEHTVLHLMYARFFYKVLVDLGFVDGSRGDEPFLQLRHQGTVLGPDNRKMSKRWGNVIDPMDVAGEFGADTLRMYEMFMGPFDVMKPWNVKSVAGVHRFLGRVNDLFFKTASHEFHGSDNLRRVLHKTTAKVGQDIENFKFNTAVASMMELINLVQSESSNNAEKETGPVNNPNGNNKVLATPDASGINGVEFWKEFLLVLAPFAPHLAEELFQTLKKSTDDADTDGFQSIHWQSWPESAKTDMDCSDVTISVSFNGKTRGTITLSGAESASQESVEKAVGQSEHLQKYLQGVMIKKIIYVPGKIINFVI